MNNFGRRERRKKTGNTYTVSGNFFETGQIKNANGEVVATYAQISIDDRGPTLVVALVQEKFEVVYQGATSEVVDLDGNGIPEIFESVWPDGDGYPRTTTIHVWDGVKYRKLTTSRWEYRFSRSVLNRVRNYNKAKLRQNRRQHSRVGYSNRSEDEKRSK